MKWYTGSGCDYELLCVPCVQQREQGDRVGVASVCEQCFDAAAGELVQVKEDILFRCILR